MASVGVVSTGWGWGQRTTHVCVSTAHVAAHIIVAAPWVLLLLLSSAARIAFVASSNGFCSAEEACPPCRF